MRVEVKVGGETGWMKRTVGESSLRLDENWSDELCVWMNSA